MKKFERVVVHVGWDKTGSSAIQHFLDENRSAVTEQFNISYPVGRWHAFLGSIFSRNPENYVFNKYTGLSESDDIGRRDRTSLAAFEQSVDELSPNKILCISYEGFVSLAMPELEELKSYLLQYSDRVDVIAYVRPIFSYARSAISQRAKQGEPFFDDGSLPRNSYKATLEKFFLVFGRANVYVRKFSTDTLVSSDVLTDFLSFCGVEPENYKINYETPARENESLSWPAVIFSDSVIRSLKKDNVEYTVAEYGRLLGGRLSIIDGPKIPIRRDLEKSLIAQSEDDADFLKREYGIDIIDSNIDVGDSESEAWENIVISLADAVSYSFGSAIRRSNPAFKTNYEGYVSARFEDSSLRVGEILRLQVSMGNLSPIRWPISASAGPRMSYHWRSTNGYYLFDGKRTVIPCAEILPGDETKVVMEIPAPDEPGEYLLIVTAVEEGRCWLENEGLIPACFKFCVS
ncbi:hypothetical protein [Marinobacter metalliresistant]|uniref:Uncharacterized protein n=1 Tax=Marinobacter metalliresistant TaxID=2961995 RepID=A0ABZ2W531_9GAMM